MAVIKSGATTDELTIGVTSKAAYIEDRDPSGRSIALQSKATYSCSTADFTPAATPTDIFRITGSATKTIRIISLSFTGTATAATTVDLFLIKRSTANNGGTTVASTLVPHDSQNAASTASAMHYTANAAGLGTAVGTIKKVKVVLPISTTVTTGLNENFLGTTLLDQPITLRGVAEALVINFAGAALPAGSVTWSVNCTYIEE